MTDKELRKLRRQDLLQLLILQSKEVSRLQNELAQKDAQAEQLSQSHERIKAKLNEKDATIAHLVKRLNEKDATIAALRLESVPIELRQGVRVTEGELLSSLTAAVQGLVRQGNPTPHEEQR